MRKGGRGDRSFESTMMKQGKRSVVEDNSTQQYKRGRNSMSSFLPPPTPMAPHYTSMNSIVTFNPLTRPTTSGATSIVSSHGSNNTSTVPINIKFCDPEQNDHISFRIMRGTPLKKAMVAYCEQQNKEFASIRFTVNGHRCIGDLTPDEMGMEDGDEVDSWLDADGA